MPQLEDGYTKIANELLEALVRTRIAGEAAQVFWHIIRKTYGFNKLSDEISLSQFVAGTGLTKPGIVRATRKLQSMNMIIKEDNGNIIKYKINKYYSTWRPLSKKITHKRESSLKSFCYLCDFEMALHKHHIVPLSKNGEDQVKNKIVLCPNCHAMVHKGSHTVKELIIIKDKVEKRTKKDNKKEKHPLSKKSTTKENTKETTNTKEKILSFFEIVWSKYPMKAGKKEALRHYKATVKCQEDVDNCEKALVNYLKHLALPQNSYKHPMNGSTWFNNWQDWTEWIEPATPDEPAKYDPQAGEKADMIVGQIRAYEESINRAKHYLTFCEDGDPDIQRYEADIARDEREIVKLRGEG